MHFCYIIQSQSLGKFYVGETSDIEQRLKFHNSGFSEFTSKAKDWQIYLLISCKNREIARKLENHIKSMKSKIYIQNLLKYPEIIEKLQAKYS
ncbi:MAG: GIY-YIG nuclease family protein [Cytophagales bacterium]|nr:GIY-YIG nuclease family protein [Cytophagales bacterium]